MFETDDRPGEGGGRRPCFLRPETAQGIFLDFKTVLQFARRKPPVRDRAGRQVVPQRDHAGNFIFRTLEFEQMEMEFFVPPDQAEHWHEHWMQARMDWYVSLGDRTRAACACARTTPTS
jgi:glycyl-tRNA synthetase